MVKVAGNNKKTFGKAVEALAYTIKSQMESQHMSVSQLAGKANVSESTVRKYINGNMSMTVTTVVTLLEALGYEIHMELRKKDITK